MASECSVAESTTLTLHTMWNDNSFNSLYAHSLQMYWPTNKTVN